MAFYKGELKNEQGELVSVFLALNKEELEKVSNDNTLPVDISVIKRKEFLNTIKDIPFENILCEDDLRMRYYAEANGFYKLMFKTKGKAFFDCFSEKIDYYTLASMKKAYNFRNIYVMNVEAVGKGLIIVGEFWEEEK